MRKILALLLALILVFSLVSCSNNTVETKKETVLETADKSVVETTDETKIETNQETGKVEVTAIALKDNYVLVNGEGIEQQIVKLEAGNQNSLVQGHKYVFTQENPEIKDPLVVENVEMLGKAVGTPIDAKLINTLIEKVEGVKIVDTRSEQQFAQGSAKGAINLPAEKLEELIEKAKSPEGLEALKGINKEDVVVVLGEDTNSNANVINELLYNIGRVSVTLDSGAYGEYKAHIN